MTVLAVDAGNTRIKWGLWDGRWIGQGAASTHAADALELAWRQLPVPQSVYACTVAGMPVRQWLEQWARAAGAALHWVNSQSEQYGVRNAYGDPSQLGADRWVAVVAARHLVDGAALVVNAGTAVTINVLTGGGEFKGGLILPGLDLMAASLATGTARLPHASGRFAPFPTNTDDAIISGAVQAVCGAVERMERLMMTQGEKPTIVLSGGQADVLQTHLERPARLIESLILEGLRIIAAADSSA
jgi:type III pantothenate kinase